jgi:hypothetical protein
MSRFAIVDGKTNKILGAYFCASDSDDELNTPPGAIRIPLAKDHPLLYGAPPGDFQIIAGSVHRIVIEEI